jgi:hypothetical protein
VLHHIQNPACATSFDNVLTFERSVLAYVCDPTAPCPPSEASLKQKLGDASGEWFFKKLWKKAAPSELGAAVAELMLLARTGGDIEQQVVDAFDNDTQFYKLATSPRFVFRFRALPAAVQAAIKKLLVLFYDDLLAGGFPPAVHGGEHALTRDRLLESFESANPKLGVCPACDGQKPGKVRGKLLADTDHYLPKSLYPFLAVHPWNLVPICLECNQRIKRAKDPVDFHDSAPLPNTFLPYVSGAYEEIELHVTRGQDGTLHLSFSDRASNPSRRMASLDRVFGLTERWSSRLKQMTECWRQTVVRHAERAGSNNTFDVGDELRDERTWIVKQCIGRDPFSILQAGYYEFAAADQDELATFREEPGRTRRLSRVA